METLIKVELSPEDAVLFKEYMKRYAFMKLLESIGAFNMKSGSLVVHFDNLGQIASIDKQEHYRL